MKRVRLKEIALRNFKGIKQLTVTVEDVTTEIRGANATGKSTIADAFNWVLFGKDVAGNSDSKFGIKTNDINGNVIPKIDHEVIAILDVDGSAVELRRVLSEDWVTPRGKAKPELKGNSTAYFYNGVPLKESEYKAKINEIINEDLFRMITNPHYFPRLDWAVQREILMKIAGGVTLEEIAAGRSEFAELLAQLSGKTLAEYKAEICARKKKIKEALDMIPARIDEVTRATPADYVQNEKTLLDEKTRIENLLSEIDKAIADKAEEQRQQFEAVSVTQSDIHDLKRKQQELLFNAQTAAQNKANEANLKRNEKQNEYNNLLRERENYLSNFNKDIASKRFNREQNAAQISQLEEKISKMREFWYSENEKEYQGDDTCPTCRQLLPENMRADKRRLFEETKQATLQQTTKNGKELSNIVEKLKKDNVVIDKYIEEESHKCEAKKKEFDDRINSLSNELKATPIIATNHIAGKDIPEWVELEEKIKFLSDSITSQQTTPPDNSELISQKKELTAVLDDIKQKLSLRSIIAANEKRKAELLNEEKNLAQQKADLEKREFLADSLVKKQMNEVERRVNHKFSLVKFKMFSQQINGGEKPDCILFSTKTGAKYMDTNNADKIGIGLDIINTLCEFNGVCAPIFCDNAESVNQYPTTKSQMIFLRVTDDKELLIK
jgi:chromosome segregation ATPase